MWQIGYDIQTQELVTVHGLSQTSTNKKGQLQTSRRAIVTNQSGCTAAEQAHLEACKRRIDKCRDGYGMRHDEERSHIPACLLTLYDAAAVKDWPVAVQAKIDGERARAFTVKGKTVLLSKTTVQWHWLEHIKHEAGLLLSHLPPSCGLDGELFLEGESFECLASTVTTKKSKPPLNDKVKLWVFDVVIDATPLEDRVSMLDFAIKTFEEEHGHPLQYLIPVPMYVANDDVEVQIAVDEFLRQGFEGGVMRYLGYDSRGVLKAHELSYYKGGRNKHTQKIKRWLDAEAEIVGVTEGSGTNAGLAILSLQQGDITFRCVPNASHAVRRDMFKNSSKLIGRIYTYQYFELTSAGVPRFPRGLRFRDDL